MSIQQSPDDDPSRVNSRLNPKPTDFLADDIVLPHVTEGGEPTKAPEAFAIKDRNFAISIFMYADNPKRVDWINVEIFSKDGTSVAHYRTSVDMPEVISREVMRLYGESNRRQDPKNMLREIVSMFKQRFPVNWVLVESFLTPPAEGAIPRFRPVIPTLNDFIVRPEIVDEHFTAGTSTQQGLARLTVKLFPHLGFMRCTVESDGISGYQREWKIKASLDGDLDLQFMNTDLLHKANELLVRLHLDGAEEVVDILDRGHFDAYATPRLRTSVTQKDKRLARGHIDTPDRATVLEHSGATVSLQVGTRFASIEIAPFPEDPSQTASIVFKCSDHYPELTGAQLHYIEKAYTRMTSHSSAERHRGALMCSATADIRPSPSERELRKQGAQPSVDSIYQMILEYWGATPDLSALLGEWPRDAVNLMPEIQLIETPPHSVEEITHLLDGGRRVAVSRLESDVSPANPHWFTQLGCMILGDGSIRVTLRNGIGGVLCTVIDRNQVEDGWDSASIIVPLIQSFAGSTGPLWTEVVGKIESFRGDSEQDLELRLTDPRYDNIPPFEDQMGARMLEECVKLRAFVTATGPVMTPMPSEIRYAGLGSAQISFLRNKKSPVLRVLLQDNELREVILARTHLSSDEHEYQATTLFRFRANGLRLYSQGYADIMEQTHEYARSVNANSWDVWWENAYPKVVQPLVDVLSSYMERLT